MFIYLYITYIFVEVTITNQRLRINNLLIIAITQYNNIINEMSSNLDKFNQLCRKVDNDNFSLSTWENYDKDDDYYCDEYDDLEDTDESDDDFFDKGVSMIKILKDVAIMSLGMDPVSKYVELVDENCELDDIAVIPVVPLPIQAYIFTCLRPKLTPLRKVCHGTIKGIEDSLSLKQRIFYSDVPQREMIDPLSTDLKPYNRRSDGTQPIWKDGTSVSMKLAQRFSCLPRWMFSGRRSSTLALLTLFLINPGDGHDTGGQSNKIEVIPTGQVGRIVPRALVQAGMYVERGIERLPERVQSHIGSDRYGVPVVDLPPGTRIGLNARRRDGEETADACIIS